MHWSVGMLLHAVCVFPFFFFFFFSKEKEKIITFSKSISKTVSSQHGAVDLDHIPSVSYIFYYISLIFRYNHCF